jgi:hypothetical protein
MIDLGDLGEWEREGGRGGREKGEGKREMGGEGTYNERRHSRVECKLILNLVYCPI